MSNGQHGETTMTNDPDHVFGQMPHTAERDLTMLAGLRAIAGLDQREYGGGASDNLDEVLASDFASTNDRAIK